MASRVDQVQIEYTLSFRAPFHFGTGIRVGTIDRTVVRDAGQRLYVPGSTFKGVLREHCEQLARLYDDGMEIASPHDARAALSGLSKRSRMTMITRIFGSQNHAGHLFFDDAHQVQPERPEQQTEVSEERAEEQEVERKAGVDVQTQLYTQVRLDRPTRTAVGGALYTSEFGISSLAFRGSINGWLECYPIDGEPPRPTYSLLLLLAGLQMIERLGG